MTSPTLLASLKRFATGLTIGGLALVASTAAWSQEVFPSRPIGIVIPFAAGGSIDISARWIATRQASALGQPVIVENRPGGDGLIAMRAVKEAPADGYTLMAVSSLYSQALALKADPGYEAKDFVAVSGMSDAPIPPIRHREAKTVFNLKCSMRYKIRHSTEYEYQESVTTGHNRLCLVPLNLPEQILLSSDIKITPTPDEQSYLTDFFGNTLLFISIYKEHNLLTIQSESMLDIQHRINGERARQSTLLWENAKAQIASQSDFYADVIQYTLPSLHVPYSEEIRKFTADCFPDNGTLWNGCQALMQKIYRYIEFKPGFTTVNTPAESVLKLRKGVCQDLAHLMIACFRNIGLPARYVSGYLETMPPVSRPPVPHGVPSRRSRTSRGITLPPPSSVGRRRETGRYARTTGAPKFSG